MGDGADEGATVGDGADEGATVGDGADESATAGLSADTGLSGCGIIDIAINVRANPVGSAIQPAHPAAGMMRRRICRSRDLGRGSDAGDGAWPCHSHKPASLLSALIKTVSVEGNIGASSETATASLYAWPIDPRCSACMAHKSPLSCSATIPRAVRRPLDGLSAAPGWRLSRLVVARCVGERNHHRFEVRGRPRVLFVVEGHMMLASAPATRLKAREDDLSSCPGGSPSIGRASAPPSPSLAIECTFPVHTPAAGQSETTKPNESD